MDGTIKADEQISTEASNWVFDEHVAPHFDDHVRKSVPEYERVQDLAAKFSDWFTHPDCTVVDFGAATGETLRRIRDRHSKPLNLVGYGNSQAMIDQAARKSPLVDVSAAWEQRGWKPAYITHTGGDLKDATWPPSFTEAHRAHLQEMVDEYFGQFRDHVLRHRQVGSGAMRGQTFIGRRAKEANLVDHVGDFADAYAELLSRVDKARLA